MSHVQQELAVLLFDPAEKPLYLLVKTQFLFLFCVENQLFCCLAFAEVRERRWLVTLKEQMVEGEFKRRRQPLEGFKRRDSVSIFDPRNIAAQQAGSFFNITLRKVSFFS